MTVVEDVEGSELTNDYPVEQYERTSKNGKKHSVVKHERGKGKKEKAKKKGFAFSRLLTPKVMAKLKRIKHMYDTQKGYLAEFGFGIDKYGNTTGEYEGEVFVGKEHSVEAGKLAFRQFGDDLEYVIHSHPDLEDKGYPSLNRYFTPDDLIGSTLYNDKPGLVYREHSYDETKPRGFVGRKEYETYYLKIATKPPKERMEVINEYKEVYDIHKKAMEEWKKKWVKGDPFYFLNLSSEESEKADKESENILRETIQKLKEFEVKYGVKEKKLFKHVYKKDMEGSETQDSWFGDPEGHREAALKGKKGKKEEPLEHIEKSYEIVVKKCRFVREWSEKVDNFKKQVKELQAKEEKDLDAIIETQEKLIKAIDKKNEWMLKRLKFITKLEANVRAWDDKIKEFNQKIAETKAKPDYDVSKYFDLLQTYFRLIEKATEKKTEWTIKLEKAKRASGGEKADMYTAKLINDMSDTEVEDAVEDTDESISERFLKNKEIRIKKGQTYIEFAEGYFGGTDKALKIHSTWIPKSMMVRERASGRNQRIFVHEKMYWDKLKEKEKHNIESLKEYIEEENRTIEKAKKEIEDPDPFGAPPEAFHQDIKDAKESIVKLKIRIKEHKKRIGFIKQAKSEQGIKGRGWHGEPGRHAEAAKKGKKSDILTERIESKDFSKLTMDTIVKILDEEGLKKKYLSIKAIAPAREPNFVYIEYLGTDGETITLEVDTKKILELARDIKKREKRKGRGWWGDPKGHSEAAKKGKKLLKKMDLTEDTFDELVEWVKANIKPKEGEKYDPESIAWAIARSQKEGKKHTPKDKPKKERTLEEKAAKTLSRSAKLKALSSNLLDPSFSAKERRNIASEINKIYAKLRKQGEKTPFNVVVKTKGRPQSRGRKKDLTIQYLGNIKELIKNE
jgi:hypothetical protein